jgi:hypothetical protein
MCMPGWRRYVFLGSLGVVLLLLGWTAVYHKKKHQGLHWRAVGVSYTRDIKPILESRCYSCHGPGRHKAGLRLDSAVSIRKGSDNGPVVMAGDSGHSLLIAAVSGADEAPRMPPTGDSLTAQQIALLKAWVDAGAPAPYEPEEPEPPGHWAFRPPVRPPLPVVQSRDDDPNPIDVFLTAQREKKGLVPSPSLSPGLLLRRVWIDLIGLPPTRAELQTFLADGSESAYERAVDRLLASPQYGERWGRHWMDVWRYSDPDGRKAKQAIWWSDVHIWRWRDWIIKSLNEDKGYDEMILEMLAGDEIAPDDPEMLAATGFLVRNWFKLNRTIWLNNTVEHTGKAFLGLTINCARCHDHKFDPISQKEYYQFRAFFEPHDIRTDGFPVDTEEQCIEVSHAYDARPDEPTWILKRGDEKNPDKRKLIRPGVPAALGGRNLHITPIDISATRFEKSTGRRLALARWLCDRENPLTARVAVNHVWARHFGRPLVDNVHDFGTRTKAPEQQPLLDWLAVEFMAHDWSLKWLHRLIVTSAAYRMESSVRGAARENLAADPENRYYWRMNPRRMEAEVVRDSLLYLSGEIDWTMGGPPLDCLQGPDSPRRSLYYRYSREDKMEFLTVFDAAAVEECYRRQESVVPQQALALENSEFVWDRARRIACRLEAESRCRQNVRRISNPSPLVEKIGNPSDDRPDEPFITAAFEHILGRAPQASEFKTCASFLARQERLLAAPSHLTSFPPILHHSPESTRVPPGLPLVLGVTQKLPGARAAEDPRQQAREYLVHALINHNDFITVR